MNEAWRLSKHGTPDVKEHGGIIGTSEHWTMWKKVKYIVTYIQDGSSNSVSIRWDLRLWDEEILGTFHTHPYKNKASAGTVHSEGDIINLLKRDDDEGDISIIESGTKRFALVIEDREKAKKFFETHGKKGIKKMYENEKIKSQKSGKSFPDSTRDAVRKIANDPKSGLKFYETTDKAKLNFKEVK